MAKVKSVLIIGGSGFVGTHLAQKLREGYKVFATFNEHPVSIPGVTCIPMDLQNKKWIKRVIYIVQPDIIIYTAGRNDLEWAESHQQKAEQIHTEGPATIASSTDIMQPRIIFISNPYVFGGEEGNYHETDTLAPKALLGKMKSAGENAIKSKCINYVIVRSAPLLGRGNGFNYSLLDNMRMTLDRKGRYEAAVNELHSFAAVEGLAELVYRLVDSGVKNKALHYGGLTKISHFELARAFAKRFGYNPNQIVPKGGSDKSKEGKIEHRYDFSLNSTQVAETLKVQPLLLEESFDLIEKQLITSP